MADKSAIECLDCSTEDALVEWRQQEIGLDWVVVGGESGRGARPMHPDWARSLRDQCQEAGVPFLFKQWGEWQYGSALRDGRGDHVVLSDGRHFPAEDYWQSGQAQMDHNDGSIASATMMGRVGKKAAGRELDGRTWDQYPEGPCASTTAT
jgi:protein gp37